MHSNGRSFAFTLAFILGSIPVLAAALLITSNSALAQNVTSSVSGTVTDISGAVVPKAKITLRNNSTGQQLSILTNGSGAYTITNIQPGTYTIQASRKISDEANDGVVHSNKITVSVAGPLVPPPAPPQK